MINRLTITLFLLTIAGCNTFPEKKEDQATYHLDIAVSSFKTDPIKACAQINASLSLPTGASKVRAVLQGNSVLRDDYFSCIQRKIESVATLNDLRNSYKLGLLDIYYTVKKSDVFDSSYLNQLSDKIGKKLYQGNINGTLPIDLTEISDDFPLLKSDKHIKKMVDRTIKHLQTNDSDRNVQVDALIKYISNHANDAEELGRIEKVLSTLNIKGDEVKLFSAFYPNYANSTVKNIASEVMVELKNADRLVYEDMLAVFQSFTDGVNWVENPQKETIVVNIEQARFIEKSLPEKVETIIYERHQVNFVNALFDMPNHASFVYDVATTENQIEYGYIVKAFKSGVKISEEIVRGRVHSNSVSCRNPKIQNAFGGVLPSGFVANEDMQRRCSNNESKTPDELKNDVYKEVLKGVLRIPGINSINYKSNW